MAVTVNTSAQNLRSDFMISDAAMPQRIAEQDNQFAKFEEMLSKVNEKLDKFKDIKKAYDEGKYDVPTVEELKKAGAINEYSSLTPKEIAKKILKGEMKIDDIPADVDIGEVLKELAQLKKSLEDEEDEDEIIAALKEIFGDEFTAELAIHMSKLAKKDEDDEDKALDANVLASLISVDVSDEISDIIKVLSGESEDEGDVISEADVIGKVDFVDAAIPEKAPWDSFEVVDRIPEENAVFETATSDEASNDVGNNMTAAEETVVNTENASKAAEEIVLNAEANTSETAISGEAAEVIQNAVQNGEISKPEIRTYAPEKTEVSEQEDTAFGAEESVPVKAVDERAKALGEELEMLKNAKQKPESEPKSEDSSNRIAAMPNSISESSIILRKDNGELQVVSQKEVVSQVQQFVEQVITENREQNEYSLMLNPEELGRITVKLTKAADGAISVTIVAENARTQRMLEQNSELMQSNLRNNGMNLESWQTVGESQQNHPAQDYSGSAKNPYFAQEDNSEEEQAEEGRSFAEIIAAM
ncbi:MAG: flagellar hook-length control protein FliK [Oscillospiraceae bacterium]|nr:flagellar hook-length control protein FliK [Oscillospiraceae bacterium]